MSLFICGYFILILFSYKAIRNMRRYSSMTSVYSMGLQGAADSCSSGRSSRENLTGSAESTPAIDTAAEKRSLSLSQSSERYDSFLLMIKPYFCSHCFEVRI